MAACFALPSENLTVFHNHNRESPVWFGSNSFSQLEMYPVEPLRTLRAPSVAAASPVTPNVQAWRVYFDGLDFYYTNIIRYTKLEQVQFLKRDLSSLVFLVVDPGRALILGAGGGIEVIQGLLAGFREIDAVDINPLIVKAIQHAQASDFMNLTGVHYYIDDGRRFLQGEHSNYNLIFIPNVRVQGVAGVINTQYMNTVELTGRCLDTISPGGSLVIRSHFHDWASLSGTLKAALQIRPASEKWTVFLASEARRKRAYSLVFLHHGPLTTEQGRRISEFITQDGFSWTQVDLNALQDGSLVLTNDHPYAANFQRISRMQEVSATTNIVNSDIAPVLVRLALPLAAALVIILSLVVLQARTGSADIRALLLAGGGFCACLGSGFLAAEMVFIEKIFLVTGNPTMAFGITVCSLLGGGLLALWLLRKAASRHLASLLPKIAMAAAFSLYVVFFTLEKLVVVSILPGWFKVSLAVLVVFGAGSLMGLLFPAALRLLAETKPDSIPWSWAINGVAAVVGGISAQLLAIVYGYREALGFAVICYGVAAITAWRMAGRLRSV